MNTVSFLCLLLALGLGLRVAMIYANARGISDERRMEYERHNYVVQQDPNNAGSYARLAEMLYEDKRVDEAIAAWRRAVYLMPQGPFTTRWKRDLKRALEDQATIARGEKPLEQKDVRICPRCEAIVPNAITICPNCGETLHLSFANTIAQTDVAKSWLKETLAVCAVLFIAGIIFSALPMEVKGTLIISATLVIGYFIIRAIGGNT
ncbi:hypothetical protein IAD21_01426 [Abditibacteriota bacterium]|nr:hypothetical protein IAD21_01426 [Abditibacteriota bacterium]